MSDSFGSQNKCPETGLELHIDQHGKERRLGLLPSEPSALLAVAPKFSDVFPIIDPGLWVEKDFRKTFDPKKFILNQASHSSCVGWSAATALMRSRAMRNMTYQRLSGSYIYSWINHGRDAGAFIPDALMELLEHGTCLEATCDVNTNFRRSITSAMDQEAARFKMEKGIAIDSYEAFGSAIQMDLFPQIGVQVSRNFSSFNQEGICGYGGRGANHSVCIGAGMVKKQDGTWKFGLTNTWALGFGPYGEGMAYIDQRHADGGGYGFVHIDPMDDPMDPNPLPVPRAA